MTDSLTVLGTRGSIPLSGPDYTAYGCATTSFLAVLNDTPILLDGGSGLMNVLEEILEKPQLTLLLSHLHLDHIIGLSMFPYLFRKDANLTVYYPDYYGSETDMWHERLFSPPLWPVGLNGLSANVTCGPLPDSFTVGNVRIETEDGEHPGGVKVIRLMTETRKIIFATDCTLTDEVSRRLTGFAYNCDLLLTDGQFFPEEWEGHEASGHNTCAAAANFGNLCHAKKVRIIHHSPWHTDEMMDKETARLERIHPDCAFAREGEIITF